MWPTATLTLSIFFICGFQAAPLSSCPKPCICTGTEFYCKSFTFLPKLSQHEITALTKLVINNSTASTNPKLSHLVKIRTLNLASNKIKQINSIYFPKSLEYLDMSNNFITSLPQDFHSSLKELKELRLSGNPISCTCDSISIRDQLLKSNVTIVTPVKCHSPENLRGKSWLSVSCNVYNLFGEMQGDAPYEGSGSGFDEIITESDAHVGDQDKSLEEEFIRVDATTETPKLEKMKDEDEDGSGSGDGTSALIRVEDDDSDNKSIEKTAVSEEPSAKVNDLLLHNVKACNFDCSTPSPAENDSDSLPPPSVFEGVKIVWDDFNILKSSEPISTTTESPVSTVSDESNKNITKLADAEILNNHIAEADKGNISETPKQSNSSTYIFLGALLVLIIALVIYAVIKKRATKRRHHSLSKANEKPATLNDVELLKSSKPANGTFENIPLMNGHGDKDSKPFEDVELRQKPNEAEGENTNLLVPEAKRVTIKASEIPNSTPKTPILVTRHINSDGNIVTTPTVHQKV